MTVLADPPVKVPFDHVIQTTTRIFVEWMNDGLQRNGYFLDPGEKIRINRIHRKIYDHNECLAGEFEYDLMTRFVLIADLDLPT